ncbi:MAG: potassium channel family protein [Candidatus Dormibacteraeota bacterium]|nr:potassium channel family protein [Candidatus Dormibacteraeota bacterium]
MAMAIRLLEGLLGLLIVVGALLDVFQSVVMPRPVAGRVRASRYLVRGLWAAVRWLSFRIRNVSRRESLLGSFGPFSVLAMLAMWVVLLLLGYAFILDSLRDQVRPRPSGLGTSLYFAATSMFTIGFGDYVPIQAPARLVSIAAGATGLGMFALVITFLYSLTAAFQRREVVVVTIEAGAGAPPSGVNLLESYALAGVTEDLGRSFERWQEWAAELLDSQLSYPSLAYFRSSHDNDSWIGSLGAVMDAATLILTTIDESSGNPGSNEVPLPRSVKGWAKLARSVGGHCIEDMVLYFDLADGGEAGVELEEYRAARTRLAGAGYRLRPEAEAWEAFREQRGRYAVRINSLAEFWASPPAQWIGDRSPLKHRVHHDSHVFSAQPKD